ncbi:ABC transporter ATP-binding protein [Angustibacter luteus]|uniref:ABC transporter ATP-binding protein n=1 Tax=Angustibacter luteus TaxID=658456 RepID=A0ABW1JGN2_9ACTN
MRTLPYADPGTPNIDGPWRLLGWIARGQKLTLAIGVLWGCAWMCAQALIPVAVGRGINEGVVVHDGSALLLWSGAVLGLACVQALSGVLRHRAAVSNWLQASFRVAQLLGYKAADTGEALPRTVPTGEVVATVTNDAMRLGGAYDVSARFAGAIASYIVVAIILVRTSVSLGLLVLLGVPVLTAVLGLLIKPLQKRQAEQREESGKLTTLGADTVAGLRVLRGIGGEQTFVTRYRHRSQIVRETGVRVAGVQAVLDAAQILLPGIFVVLVTWLGARLVVQGEIEVGDLVMFYGLSAFLVTPLRTATEMVDRLTRAHIGARRVINVLRVSPYVLDRTPGRRVDLSDTAPLHDPTSGATLPAGRLTAVVSRRPEESAALADRLGRFSEVPGAPVLLGDERIDLIPLPEMRHQVVVSESDPRLFTGSLRAQLVGPQGASDDEVARAIDTAAAHDVLDALPDGIHSEVEERGRSFSGGQRQRLSLARALLTDAPTLVLVEPTSAVDAHTEARIASRMRAHRSGQTTVVMTASPLLLDHADHVLFLDGGAVVAEGTHRELLASTPAYRHTVIRGEDE